MKTLFTSILLFLTSIVIFGQNTLSYSPILPNDNIITDAIEINNKVYTLQVDIGNDYSSNLLLINPESGEVLDSHSLSKLSFLAARIIKIKHDSVYLLGRFKMDTCNSLVVSAWYDLSNRQLGIISEIPFCASSVQNLRIQKGLENDWLINGYWVDNGHRRFILKMDNEYHLTLIKDSIITKMASIDFSRQGYLIKDESFCTFYDKDFNFRKDRYSITEGINNIHQTHLPYGTNYILESFSGSPEYENTGHHIRIIDSSLHVINQLYIEPGTKDFTGGFEPPFFGGIDFINESKLWIVGNNNILSNLTIPTHFSVSKINEDLQIECNQYIGFDACYRMYGLRATDDGGVLVYGMKYNESYDPFLIKLGPNCELPTVSTEDEDNPLISISAYPNPGINELSFSIQGFDPANLRVELIDMVGKVLFSADDLSTNIEVADFPAGQYFYRILQKNRLLGVGSWVKQ